MGLGLRFSNHGKYVAFSAGTGILVFMDLIAHLILRLLQSNGCPNIFGNNFSIQE